MSASGQERFEAMVSAQLCSGVKRVEQLMMAEKLKALRTLGLTVPQYAVLLMLRHVSGRSAAQLARAALVSPQTMATILGNLEARGLLTCDVSMAMRRFSYAH
ncbi:MAG: helix-turn-helix domain-containing protein [Corynebacterium sp.]|nr:helix-turn-helix domain-containing protein [Corynebacterium sp.]